jgi:xanthine dehydrogenase accessory factor
MNQEVFAAVADALERGEPAALVTIVSTTGSTPQRVGAKMLVFADGRIVGTIGGGCYGTMRLKAREAIGQRRPQLVHYELSDDFAQETGLICGGDGRLSNRSNPRRSCA